MHSGKQKSEPEVRSIDWYAPGESQTVVVGDQEIQVRLVERRGRRGRIVITAPAGATFIKHADVPRERRSSSIGRERRHT